MAYFVNFRQNYRIKFVIILINSFFYFSGIGQENKPRFVISNDDISILYIGLENHISVAVDGYEAKNVFVSSKSNVKITGSDGKYIIILPNTRGRDKIVNIEVFVKINRKDTIKIGDREFRIKPIPDPTAYFGNLSKGFALPAQLSFLNFLVLRIDNFPYTVMFKVLEFKLIITSTDGYSQYFETKGPSLSSEMKYALNQCKSGDKIIFYDIYGQCKQDDRIVYDKIVPDNIELTVK